MPSVIAAASSCTTSNSSLSDYRNIASWLLFSQDAFKRDAPDHLKELRDDYGNLALVIGDENSGKQNRPLADWLTGSPHGPGNI
jgi:hypothetical protein